MNAARCTSERLEDLCKTELTSTIETFDSPVPRPPTFQSMPTTPDRTQVTLERSKVYWSWALLLHAQGQRGNSYKTSPYQHQQGEWNRNFRSVDAHDQKTQQQESRATAEGGNHWVNSKDRNAPIRAVEKTTNHSRASRFIRLRMTRSTSSPEEE